MENKEIRLIGKVDFLDKQVEIYYDPYTDEDNVNCAWQARNPDSYYKGIVYMDNKTGKISYPSDAIIPEQTKEDREILPKFVVTGQKELSEKLINSIKKYFVEEHEFRNGLSNDKNKKTV